ncbi:MAG TPA: (2Fe-2S)-binding protein, partial [Burkholderiaceae bacterium]|nr:(2Fe-2S)-binding protein [Burkholderiaceae bacterium]
MQRRDFLATCAVGLVTEQAFAAVAAAPPKLYQRSRLVDPTGRAIRAAELPPRRNLLFHYPYRATPA